MSRFTASSTGVVLHPSSRWASDLLLWLGPTWTTPRPSLFERLFTQAVQELIESTIVLQDAQRKAQADRHIMATVGFMSLDEELEPKRRKYERWMRWLDKIPARHLPQYIQEYTQALEGYWKAFDQLKEVLIANSYQFEDEDEDEWKYARSPRFSV